MSGYLDFIQAALGQRLDEIEPAYREDLVREMTEDEYYIGESPISLPVTLSAIRLQNCTRWLR